MERLVRLSEEFVLCDLVLGHLRVELDDFPALRMTILPLGRNGRVPYHLKVVCVRLELHLVQQPTSQIVVVPHRLDEEDSAAGGKARVGSGEVPILELFPDVEVVRFLHVFDWIVDNQDVRSFTGNTTSSPCGCETPALRGEPRLHALRLHVQIRLWEYRVILLRRENIAHTPGKPRREVEVVADVDDFVIGMMPKVPRGENLRG